MRTMSPRAIRWSARLAATAAVLVAGCGSVASGQAMTTSRSAPEPTATAATTAQNIPEGTSEHTLTVDGRRRTFLVYRPNNDHSRSYPLVVVYHGGTGSAVQAERQYHWNAQARKGNFIVAYGQGVAAGWSVGGGCCGIPARLGVNDVDYTKAMVNTIEASVTINQDRIDATGLSEGAMMAYHLACNTSIFAAIAPVSGTQYGSCENPTPTSVLDIHGTADPRIPYNGSTGAGINRINGPSIPSLQSEWRNDDNCHGHTTTQDSGYDRTQADCESGISVEGIKIIGGGHHWPGTPAPTSGPTAVPDEKSNVLDATPLIAEFFANHPKPSGSGS